MCELLTGLSTGPSFVVYFLFRIRMQLFGVVSCQVVVEDFPLHSSHRHSLELEDGDIHEEELLLLLRSAKRKINSIVSYKRIDSRLLLQQAQKAILHIPLTKVQTLMIEPRSHYVLQIESCNFQPGDEVRKKGALANSIYAPFFRTSSPGWKLQLSICKRPKYFSFLLSLLSSCTQK